MLQKERGANQGYKGKNMESHMTIGITVRKEAGGKKKGKRNLAD